MEETSGKKIEASRFNERGEVSEAQRNNKKNEEAQEHDEKNKKNQTKRDEELRHKERDDERKERRTLKHPGKRSRSKKGKET